MVSAEKNAIGDVCFSAVSVPVMNVMCFRPRWGPLASGPAAAAVASGEGEALVAAEEALLAPEVEGLAGACGVTVNGEGDGAGGARGALDRGDGDGVGLAFDPPAPAALLHGGGGGDDAHPDGSVAEQL